jgi:hypothetical protein
VGSTPTLGSISTQRQEVARSVKRAAGTIAVVMLASVGIAEFAIRFSGGAGVADAAYHAWVLALGVGAVILAMLIEGDATARPTERRSRSESGRDAGVGR